jgi:hypothetical protein
MRVISNMQCLDWALVLIRTVSSRGNILFIHCVVPGPIYAAGQDSEGNRFGGAPPYFQHYMVPQPDGSFVPVMFDGQNFFPLADVQQQQQMQSPLGPQQNSLHHSSSTSMPSGLDLLTPQTELEREFFDPNTLS